MFLTIRIYKDYFLPDANEFAEAVADDQAPVDPAVACAFAEACPFPLADAFAVACAFAEPEFVFVGPNGEYRGPF